MTRSRRSILASAGDRHVFLALAAVCAASRIPFLSTFELVAYDGTYYLNQARTLFSGHMAGAFPLGYPLAVALFRLACRDWQLAGQAVSLAAGLGSAMVAYLIAKRFVTRESAIVASILLALNPLAARLSLMTLSESLYVFWVLVGLLMFVERRNGWFGLAMGAAAVTRPEAVAIAALLGLSRFRRPTGFAAFAAGFLLIYAANAAVLSAQAGRVIVLPKTGWFGSGAQSWKLREAIIDFEGKDEVLGPLNDETNRRSIAADYAARLPRELRLLARHASPVVLLLALIAMRRRKHAFLAAALVPFLVYPLATVRSSARYLMPYVPILILLSVFALPDLRRGWARTSALTLLVLSALALPVANRDQLLRAEEPGLIGMKKAGLAFRARAGPRDKVAGRKPYFAFYSGGEYVQLPVAPYDAVMEYLVDHDVKYLALHRRSIHTFRPALRPLMYSRLVINGELRYRQTYVGETGEMVFERTGAGDRLVWTPVSAPGNKDTGPAWSPDGRVLAFRSAAPGGAAGIYVVETDGRKGPARAQPRKIAEAPDMYDPISWSPDGRRIAYARDVDGALNVWTVDISTGRLEQVTSGTGTNISPSWSATGSEIAYSSERTGQREIYIRWLETGDGVQLTTDGGNSWPVFSPAGDAVAWVKQGVGVDVFTRADGRRRSLRAPSRVAYAPAWSPDGRRIAVTADNWGSWDIYLLNADGSNGLLLTKNPKRDITPAWRPDGRVLALTSERGGKGLGIWIVDGLDPYLERLDTPARVQVFAPTH